jgi:hypothetical protein
MLTVLTLTFFTLIGQHVEPTKDAYGALSLPGYRFLPDPRNPGAWYVLDGGQQVGWWRNGKYWPWSATEGWGRECPPPWAAGPQPENFGLDLKQWPCRNHRPGVEYFSTGGGWPLSRDEALALIRGDAEAGKLHLTIIGSDADRSRVLKDLDQVPELVKCRDLLHVQDYPPDHWAVQCGFKTGGHPTIYLQAAGGRVLHRQDDYEGPAGLVAALRKADPNYSPDSDPDLRRQPLAPALAGGIPLPVLASAAGLLLLIFMRR